MKPSLLSLPSARDVVADPASRPVPKVGEDLGVIALRFAVYGDANAELLRQAQENYEAVRARYAGRP